MERSQLLDLMGELKLYGMKAAYDEVMTTAVKRQHEPQRVVGDLLTAEISEKQARSIKCLFDVRSGFGGLGRSRKSHLMWHISPASSSCSTGERPSSRPDLRTTLGQRAQ